MDAKMPGEDYMGDSYEGYIPGALEELHSEGTLPSLQMYFILTRSMVRSVTHIPSPPPNISQQLVLYESDI